MKALRLALAVLAAVLMLCAACAESDPPDGGAPSQSPASRPPSEQEILAAFTRLAPEAGFDYHIELSPKPGEVGMDGMVWISAVTRDATGRWLASAEIVPPGYASSNPMTMFIAKDSDGWRRATATETAVLEKASPTPMATVTVESQ